MYAFHKHEDESNEPEDPENEGPDDMEEEDMLMSGADQSQSDGSGDLRSTSVDTGETLRRAAAVLILKLREHLLPQSVTENIVKDIDSMYQVSVKACMLTICCHCCVSTQLHLTKLYCLF